MTWKNRFLKFVDIIIIKEATIKLSIPYFNIVSKIHSLIEDKFLYPIDQSLLSLHNFSINPTSYSKKDIPVLNNYSNLLLNNCSINSISYSKNDIPILNNYSSLLLNSCILKSILYDEGGNIIIED